MDDLGWLGDVSDAWHDMKWLEMRGWLHCSFSCDAFRGQTLLSSTTASAVFFLGTDSNDVTNCGTQGL
jgi:hypothetical protein